MSDAQWKKAVFVYPKLFADTYWSFNRTLKKYLSHTEFGTPKASLPPIGLLGLADYQLNAHKDEEFKKLLEGKKLYENIEVTDRNVDNRPFAEVIADADHVYIGAMIAQKKGTIRDAKITKDLGKILIVGGTLVDKDSKIAHLADYAVENEAEMVIDQLNFDLLKGNTNKYYKGTAATPEKFFTPDFSLVNLDNYINVALQISRGCPEDCEFCDITSRFGRRPRITPIENIEQGLRQLYELGSRQALFAVDDNFIGNPQRTIETLKEINMIEKDIGYNRPKFTELTLRLADDSERMDELRQWLHKTNFFSFFTGVETPNLEALKETGKAYNFKNSTIEEKMYSISKKTGAAIMTGMIHGFDSDTRESVNKTIDFINNTHSVLVMEGLLMALPHTKLEKRLRKEGRLMTEATGDNSDGLINFIPYNFSAKEAEEDIVKIQEGIYAPKAYFKRVMRELEVVEPISASMTRTKWESAKTLVKILTKDNAFHYWKNMPEALRIANKRFKFGTAENFYIINEYFTHAARYTHFRGQTKQLRKNLNEKLKNNDYQPWQLYSWKELQESPIQDIKTIEKEVKNEYNLLDKIYMTLQNGYEFVGTRLEALQYFVQPYLKEQLVELKNIKIPTKDQLFNAEKTAYEKAHHNRPQILDKIDFKAVENYLNETLNNQINYFNDMTILFRTTTRQLSEQ